MSVNSIQNTGLVSQEVAELMKLLRSVQAGQAGSTTNQGSETSALTGVSKFAEMLHKLEELKTSNPEKYKQILSEIADKLKRASQELGDGFGSKLLSELADKFQSVADGGDISQLLPPPPPGPSGGIKAHYSQQDDQSLLDLVNGAGGSSTSKVNIQELLASILEEINQATSQ